MNCDGITNEEDESLADMNGDGMVNILDDSNRDGVVDDTDDDLIESVMLAEATARKELDKGGSFSQAKAKAYEAVNKDRGVSPSRAKITARIGTVNAVGDKVGDGVSKDVKKRIIWFDPPKEIGLGDTRIAEAVILRGFSEALQRESARQGREIHAAIKVERVMQADLDGNKFTIDPPEGDNQEWKPTSRPEWSWQITPNSSGPKY